MADINYRQNVTVWLRYGHEMNGDWYPWGVMPEQFVASWRMVASAVHAKTNRTYMNWSPNARFADSLSDTRGGYTQYWPGKQYVDMVGLSYYHYGGYERLNQVPSPGEALGVLSEFDRLYSSAQGLPMILSETSASYVSRQSGGNRALTELWSRTDYDTSDRAASGGRRIAIRHQDDMAEAIAKL